VAPERRAFALEHKKTFIYYGVVRKKDVKNDKLIREKAMAMIVLTRF
jgi:hypothetical protein